MEYTRKLWFLIKEHYLIAFVFVCGVIMRLYMANLDSFLHDWDERFHALVAKNMINHPFKPMLYAHQYFATDKFNWTYNHIWLHKQPLFLWQMALSMKLFGVSEFTLRIPSVIMGSLMILLVYRICLLATSNKWPAVFAGLLLCCSNYYLNLISGREGMDHNDIAFGFYVLASFWAYAEYLKKPSKKWVLMIGIFAGCAILNKWLTGLLVFAPWGIQLILDFVRDRKSKVILDFILALLVCTVIFLPWQIYILHQFPELALYEYSYNSKHLFEVVEGHGGDVWYYLNSFPQYFGYQTNYLVPIGLLVLCFNKITPLSYKIFLVLPGVLVFCFFSFIVQSKVKAYFFVVGPICLIYSGIAFNWLIDLFGRFKKYIVLPLIALSIYYSINISQINKVTQDVSYRQSKIYNTNIYKKLNKIIPPEIEVILNANSQEHVDIMFYSRFEAYHSHITEEEFKFVTQSGKPIAAFKSRDQYQLDDYISNYKNIYLISVTLK